MATMRSKVTTKLGDEIIENKTCVTHASFGDKDIDRSLSSEKTRHNTPPVSCTVLLLV